MKGKTRPSAHDMRCFVGMIETGEATHTDFVAAHGADLAELFTEQKQRWDAERKSENDN